MQVAKQHRGLNFFSVQCALILCAVFFCASSAFAQVLRTDKKNTRESAKTTEISVPDTARTPLLAPDSANITVPEKKVRDTTFTISRGKSGLDTTVVYYARDSVKYSVKNRTMRLRGNAWVKFGSQKLEADIIEIDFEHSVMTAFAGEDERGKKIGIPKFSDKSESFYGERLAFNFKTKKGIISLGETSMNNGFYFGEKIKRVDESTLFIQDGCFTTCNHPQPHYYFKSPTMKLIQNDRIFVDPLLLYIEDIPVFALPFGLFIESKSGRRSGLIIPSFFFSSAGGQNRGIVLQNMGYYWATSDYFDTQVTADITTKGGFTLHNLSRFVLRDQMNSSLSLAYGKTRNSPSENFSNNWSLNLNHAQTFDPYTSLRANVQFSSNDFYKNTSTDLNQRVQQNIRSTAAFDKRFDNNSALTVNYSRDQNILTGTYSELFPDINYSFSGTSLRAYYQRDVNQESGAKTQILPYISYSVPLLFPLRSLAPKDSWLGDISISGNLNGMRKITDPASADTVNKHDESSRITMNPSINISPKFGYFTVSPQISYGSSWYFRRLTKSVKPSDSTITKSYESGIFREYDWSLGLSVGTKLYGIAQPGIFGINALRHILQPSLGFRYKPNFSDESYDFNAQYFDVKTGRTVRYSRFESDGGSVRSGLEQSMTFGISNAFDAKIAVSDTAEQAVQLFNFDISGAYNFAADSLKLSAISTSFRTSAGVLTLNGGASFTAYDQAKITRISGTTSVDEYVTLNRFLISEGKGLLRLSDASLTLSTALSSGALGLTPTADTTRKNDSIDYGMRFSRRFSATENNADMFGDSSPGFSPVVIPWNLSLFFSFRYSAPHPDLSISRSSSLGASFDFSPTATWKVRSSLNYDFVQKEVIVPSVELTKSLSDCWDLIFNWIPSGYSSGFYLRIGVKAPELRDLKLEKRENVLYR